MPLSWNEIRDRSVAFVREWESESSESAEAKSFWDAFFHVFGISRRRVAAFEQHVKKADGNDGFIDLFWPGVLLAEHKSRGRNLDSAFVQAIDYFPGLKDKELPRYIIVSDFAKFRLRNLDTSEEFEFSLEDLPKNLSLFGFIAGYEAREYKEQDPVNINAAQKLASLHDALKEVGYEGHQLEVYLVRILFCLFAEDTGIFMPRSAFEDFVLTRTAEDGSDLAPRLNQIFQTLNTPEGKRLKNLDEQIAAFPYVNGKLFDEFLPQASFDSCMREILLECCEVDWGGISPAIFGSLFQGVMEPELRRNLGAHYTSEKNILKLIGPLFMDGLKAEFEKVKTQPGKLKAFHEKLGELSFFDPACGCGNFLVISYREIRLLELDVIKRLYEKQQQQLSMDAVDQYVKIDVDNFHGIEIEEWPAQIAQVAMWLIDHQMNLLVGTTFGQALVRIPLVKSANIVHGNALRLKWEDVLPAQRCNYIFGNPPFIGKQYQSSEQKSDMKFALDGFKGARVLDFVAAWYVLAVRYMQSTSTSDAPLAAFVSTNSIVQGEQVGALWVWMFSQRVRIFFAHRTFNWKSEARGAAAVHCVIIGFQIECESSGSKPRPSVIFDYEDIDGESHATSSSNINCYLVDAPNGIASRRSSPMCDVPKMLYGSKPVDGGHYLFTTKERDIFLEKQPEAAPLFKRYMGATEFLYDQERWCLWLKEASVDLIRLPLVRERIERVAALRAKSTKAATVKLAKTPTLFAEDRHGAEQYMVVPESSLERRNYIPTGFSTQNVVQSNLNYTIPNASLYHLGVFSSSMHMAWVRCVCGRLKSDYRYSAGIVYNNFPWPINATNKQKEKIAVKAQAVLDIRAQFPGSNLAELYDPLSMPPILVKAHQSLDQAVDSAYVPSGGKRVWPTEAARVAFLFELHQKILST